jgi:hypothetical protein
MHSVVRRGRAPAKEKVMAKSEFQSSVLKKGSGQGSTHLVVGSLGSTSIVV